VGRPPEHAVWQSIPPWQTACPSPPGEQYQTLTAVLLSPTAAGDATALAPLAPSRTRYETMFFFCRALRAAPFRSAALRNRPAKKVLVVRRRTRGFPPPISTGSTSRCEGGNHARRTRPRPPSEFWRPSTTAAPTAKSWALPTPAGGCLPPDPRGVFKFEQQRQQHRRSVVAERQ